MVRRLDCCKLKISPSVLLHLQPPMYNKQFHPLHHYTPRFSSAHFHAKVADMNDILQSSVIIPLALFLGLTGNQWIVLKLQLFFQADIFFKKKKFHFQGHIFCALFNQFLSPYKRTFSNADTFIASVCGP